MVFRFPILRQMYICSRKQDKYDVIYQRVMMFKNNNLNCITYVLLSCSTPLMAAEEDGIPTWRGDAELGFISTSGNTDTETLNAKVKVINEREKWKHTITAEATKASDSGVVTAQRNFMSGKTDYKFTKRSYIFGLLQYEDDRFSGYYYQASFVIGYGNKIIDTDTLLLDVEIGAGTKQSKLETGETTDEGILYTGMEVDWKLSKSASFNEKLSVENGEQATTTKSISALKAKINSKLASKITYTVKHVSDVPVGIEQTDKEMAVTLVYNF